MLHTAITHKVHPAHVWMKTEILRLPLALNKEQVESHLDHWFQERVQYQNDFDIFASSVVCRSYLLSLHFQFVSWLWEQIWQVWFQRRGHLCFTLGRWLAAGMTKWWDLLIEDVRRSCPITSFSEESRGTGRRRTGIHPLLSAPPHFTFQGSTHVLGGPTCRFMTVLEIEKKAFLSRGVEKSPWIAWLLTTF